jgi:hypothetical protein
MKGEQLVIVRWMQAQLQRLGWTAQLWATRARVSPTTLTRSMQPAYDNVTSIPTLDALARAAGLPSVLDFLEEQTERRNAAPTPAATRAILAQVLPMAGCKAMSDADLDKAAEAIAFGFALLARDPARAGDPGAIAVAADAAASRFQ